MFRLLEKAYITGSLGYGAYLAAFCPCEPLLECHFTEFLLATAVPVFYIVLINIKDGGIANGNIEIPDVN
jgi:hypothetical protein